MSDYGSPAPQFDGAVLFAPQDASSRTAVGSTVDRRYLSSSALTVLTSGQLHLTAMWLPAGAVVAHLSAFSAASTVGPAHLWMALYDLALARLGVTNDDTSAWGNSTIKTLDMASPYTVPTSGLYYAGITQVAGTVAQLRGVSGASPALGIAPKLNGDSTTGLTDPASAPSTAGAITASGPTPMLWAT